MKSSRLLRELQDNYMGITPKKYLDIPKALDRCDQVMAFSMYAMVYFISISIALVESFFGLVLASFFVKRGIMFYGRLKEISAEGVPYSWFRKIIVFWQSFKPIESHLNWPMGTFILAGFLSMFVSHYPILSIKGFFFKLLEWTYVYFILIECINSRKRLKVLMIILIVSSTLASLNGLVQHFVGREFIGGRALFTGRVSGAFRHPNDFGGYLVVICPLLFSFLWHYPGGNLNRQGGVEMLRQGRPLTIQLLKILFTILFILSVFNLGWTYSRGAWLAFFVTMLYLGMQRGKLIIIPIMIIGLFLFYFTSKLGEYRNVYLLSDHSFHREGSSVDSLDHELPVSQSQQIDKPELLGENKAINRHGYFELFKEFGGSGRKIFWEGSIKIIRRSPILGMGINTYSQVAKGKGGYPHNCYLQIAAEMGLFGCIAFLWLVFTLFYQAHRKLSKVDDGYLFFVLSGTLAGLLGFLLHSFVDTNFYSVQLGNLMWVAMGIIVAAQKIDRQLKDHENIGK